MQIFPVVFLLLAVLLYCAMHAVLAVYLLHATGELVAVPLMLGGLLSVIAILVSRLWRNKITEGIAVLGGVWMGSAFIGLIVVLPLEIIAHLFNVTHAFKLAAVSIVALVLTSLVLARWTKVSKLAIPLKGLRKKVRVVQLSDLHIGDNFREGFLRRVVRQSNQEKPDIVVITGDLFDGAGKLHEGMVDGLRELKAKHVLYVNGNHEIYEGLEATNNIVDSLGNIRRLDDEVFKCEGIQFIGLSYPLDAFDDKRKELKQLVAKTSPAKPVVLLRHEPRDVDFAASLRIDLQLSGHTHNGQLWPLSYLVLLAYKFRVGFHRISNYSIYISQGTGCWGPPMRLGSRSEIAVIELVPNK
jgi:uncharacterized protein